MVCGCPTWSHDGKHIYGYCSKSEGMEGQLYRVEIASGKMEEVANSNNLRLYWGLVGPWTGLTPVDSPLIAREVGTTEIYALEWEER